MQDELIKRGAGGRIGGILVIVAISASLGMLAGWRAPGIDRYTRDWLMRVRGSLAVPEDITIVAIDESSIKRFGRFPWPRSLSARAIDAIAAGQPKVIAVDVLYSDTTTEEDDANLARSIARAGNVVIAAQLVDSPVTGGPATWLLPLSPIRQAAAGLGHVNVTTESEGIAREILLRAADDKGQSIRSIAVEGVRVGDGTPKQAVTDSPGALLLGSRSIPSKAAASDVLIDSERGFTQTLRASRMEIDYIGPAGSFAPRTYSFADVVEGHIQPARFQGKYVLVGATAASLGDRLSSPFVHQPDVRGGQHGSLMPGVEVLANAMNTILRSRFYTETPDWLAFLSAALVAALTVGMLTVAQGGREVLKQTGTLAGLTGGILLVSYLAFTHFLIFPPLTSSLVSFASAGLLGLLHRSLATSAQLEASIEEISRAGEVLAPASPPTGAAESVGHLVDATAVAIFRGEEMGRYRCIGRYGAPLLSNFNSGRSIVIDLNREQPERFFSLPANHNDRYELLKFPLTVSAAPPGMLVIAHASGRTPSVETLRICAMIAASSTDAEAGRKANPGFSGWWPRGVEWKARALRRLNGRILERAQFMDLALRSVEDGLIIAAADGRITYANRRAVAILGSSDRALIGRDLFKRLAEAENALSATGANRETLEKLLIDRAKVEREITIGDSRPRHYTLRMAAVSPSENGNGAVLGIVASLSDVTRQHELQQTKNDVVALVSHEMRTPLTAIQGMSELLANYELDKERRREMSLAINSEVKRLTRMTGEYLDITRLESGATILRLGPVRVDTLIERTLLLLDPIAGQRGIRLTRRFPSNLPVILADADLLSRAVQNLANNAIKYSPAATEVAISANGDAGGVSIEVTDQGYGISVSDLQRIFEKFYRVPRLQDADVPGSGLGLALVREIAELHGGIVTVKSRVGVGSTFTLRIPQAKPEH